MKPQPQEDPMSDLPVIIGMACRVPGADTPRVLWDNILAKKDFLRLMPKDRFNIEAFYHPVSTHKGTTNAKHGYFIDQPLGDFDAEFFGISGKESEAMDPQQRMLLEVTYEALEDAGLPLADVRGSLTSVYCGMYTTSNDYHNLQVRDLEYYPKYTVTGTGNSILSNRISYAYDLRGPSMTVDTACSSSLVAFDLGCKSLRDREADISVVLGSALHFGPSTFQAMTDMGILSSDARCRSFDAEGSGYVRGDGVCAIVLKRFHNAVEAGDNIRSIVRGSGVNHDGKTDGITLPSPEAQKALITAVYAKAGLDPDETGYIEAHGTGTKAGDPKEAQAIGLFFGTTTRATPLYMGSVKSNIGHTEGAAGIVGIIKATLAIQNATIPPNMHFNTPNPEIPFDDWKLKVPTVALEWTTPDENPRRASINSFGYGGTNGHVILEQHVRQSSIVAHGPDAPKRPYLLPITSHSLQAGELTVRALSKYLQSKPSISGIVKDVAYSLSIKRSFHSFRTFTTGSSLNELVGKLESMVLDQSWTKADNSLIRIGFIFTGQGAQTHNMGRQLILQSSQFRSTLEKCDEVLQELPEKPHWKIIDELLLSETDSRLSQSRYSQPICTAIQLALIDLLAHWGIHPSAVCGHSSGEIAAAYASGILSFSAAIAISFYRGLHMSATASIASSGAMMAVGLSESAAKIELIPYSGRLNIAAINSPSSVTISGDADAIAKLHEELLQRKIFTRRLKVEQAFHSHHMVSMAPQYQQALQNCNLIKTYPATCRMFSSLTARLAEPHSMGPAYWAANMVKPVRFSDAITGTMMDEDEKLTVDMLMEIGPHPVLSGPTKETQKLLGIEKMPYIATLSRDVPAFESLLNAVGKLFTLGYPIDFQVVNGSGNRLDDFPTYSWNHKNYWSMTRLIREHLHRSPGNTLLGVPVPGSIHSMPRWRNYIRLHEIPWLKDHSIDGKAIFPAAGYCCMAVEAAVRLRPELRKISVIRLKEVVIKAALLLHEDSDEGAETVLELRPVADSARTFSDEWYEFSVFSYDHVGEETQHCHGRISIEYGPVRPLRSLSNIEKVEALIARSDRYTPAPSLYGRLKSIKLDYGPYFALLNGDIASGPGFSVAQSTFDPSVFPLNEQEEKTILHPSLLDSMFHVLFSAIETLLNRHITDPFVPTYMGSLNISGTLVEQAGRPEPRSYTVQAHTELLSQRTTINNILLHQTDSGDLIIEANGIELTALGSNISKNQGRALFFRQRWQPCFDLLGETETKPKIESLHELVGLYAFQHPSSNIFMAMRDSAQGKALLDHLTVEVTTQPLYKTIHSLQTEITNCTTISRARVSAKDSTALTFVSEPQGTYDLIITDKDASVSALSIHRHLGPGAVLITNDPLAAHQHKLTKITSSSDWNAFRLAITTSPGIDLMVVLAAGASARTKAIVEELKSSSRVKCLITTTIDQALEQDFSVTHVVVLASLDTHVTNSRNVWAGTRHLLTQENITLVWVTEDATMQANNPEQAKAVGLLRVARNENRESRFISLDVESSSSSVRVAKRVLEILEPSNTEEDFADRGGVMYVPRIEEDVFLNRKLPDGVGSEPRLERLGDCPPLSLRIGKVGLLETLHFVEDASLADPILGRDEVEFKVKAAALNFHELAVALGIVQDYKMSGECAGVVTRVGAEVVDFAPGDRVVTCRPGYGAFGTMMRQRAAMCLKIPDAMSFALAATLPVTLITAYYSLTTLARVQAGETVLIHSAAGGVGQYAIQIAQKAGAKVLATCSEPKRALLRERFGLSDRQIFSSRDDSFVRGILDATNGKGVDIIINSLSGRLLHATWGCIRPFGRFIEIGKRDIHQNSNLNMEPFRRNVSFISVDLILVFELDKVLGDRLIREALRLAFDGDISPPEGLFKFSYGQVERAFRFMQRGLHTGKIVLIPDDDEKVMVAPLMYQQGGLFTQSGTYLLVGGLGGLGTALAEWMFLRGARRFAFMSRTGDHKDYAKKTVSWLRSKNAEVVIYKGDVGEFDDVMKIIQKIGPSLSGVFHMAVVLEDATIRSISFERLQRGIRTKCAGAWNLHKATLTNKLDFFVCWSSVSAICGNRGQSAYVAANAYMDALMRWRRDSGLVGTAINVGAVLMRGLLTENEHVLNSLERSKFDTLTEQELMFLVEESVSFDKPNVDADGLDWHQLITGINIKQPDLWWAERSVFRRLYANRAYESLSSGVSNNHAATTATRLQRATNIEDKLLVLQGAFTRKVATVLGTPSERIMETNPLSFYGLDSIVAVEFRKWFKDIANIDLSLFEILGAKSIRGLLEKAVSMIPLVSIPLSQEGSNSNRSGGVSSIHAVNNNNSHKAMGSHISSSKTSGPVPASTFQARMFTRDVRSEQKGHLNLAGLVKIEGSPCLASLDKAHQETIRRHPILRTAFINEGDTLLQTSLPEWDQRLSIVDKSHTKSPLLELQELVTQLRHQRLAISEGKVTSTAIVKIAKDLYFLVFIVHHICFDATSATVFINTWMELYEAFRAERDIVTIPAPKITYADFTTWHNNMLESPESYANLKFWAQKLQDIPIESKLLPCAKQQRSSVWLAERRLFAVRLERQFSKRMKRICSQMGVTPFHFLLAAWRVYHFQHTRDPDLVILMLDGNRPHADAETLIGCFVNLLPLRFQDDCRAMSFEEAIVAARDIAFEALEHSAVSFDTIADTVLPEKPTGFMPVGQVAINYQMYGTPWHYRHADFQASIEELQNIPHPCELSLEIVEGAEGELDFTMQHSTALYTEQDMNTFGKGFITFVQSVVRDHRQLIGDMEIGEVRFNDD